MNKKISINRSNCKSFMNIEKIEKQFENVYIRKNMLEVAGICSRSIYNRTLSNTTTKEDIIKFFTTNELFTIH